MTTKQMYRLAYRAARVAMKNEGTVYQSPMDAALSATYLSCDGALRWQVALHVEGVANMMRSYRLRRSTYPVRNGRLLGALLNYRASRMQGGR